MGSVASIRASPGGWRGQVFVGSGWLLYSGSIGAAALHTHHALQVLVARDGVVRITDGEGRASSGAVVVVAPGAAHAAAAAVPSGYLLYLEPRSRAAGRIRPSGGVASPRPNAAALGALVSAPEPRTLEAARGVAIRIVGLASRGGSDDPRRPGHASVRRALDLLPGLIERHGSDLRLPRIAEAVGRSAEGLSRAFNDEIGMSVPAYVRWARLRFVARSLARGRTLTEAAQDAGFSDGAHLSRVFRETFGIRPSELSGCARWTVGDEALD